LEKRNAAQAEYHRLAASVRHWALKSPNTYMSRATPKGSTKFYELRAARPAPMP